MTADAVLRHLGFCALLALFSAAVVRAMCFAGVLDRPDARKAHARPTPKGGGVGVVAAFLVGMVVLYRGADFARLADPYFRGVILAAVAIAAVAFVDDIRDWPFTVKLAAQFGAALLAVGSGLWVRRFNLPGAGPVDLGLVGAAITLGWIVLATNAVNFIDGLNGLASGVALIACGFLAVIAATHGGPFVYFAALLLGAGLLGFLPFNFPRARIFLGDVGSQFCGFVLAVLGVAASRFERADLSFLLVPMLLSGVLADVAFTLARRILAGQALAQAHRSHVYQVAQRAGVPATAVTLVHWGFAAWGGAVSLLFLRAAPTWKPILPLLLLPPQLGWLGYAAWRARRAGINRW